MIEWRIVPSFPDYEVSDKGAVRRASTGRVLAQRPCRNGYPMVHVSRAGKKYLRDVHRFVAEAFLGTPSTPKAEVRHLDGSRTNNEPSNLRWGTRAENAKDKLAHGTDRNGERHPLARLTLSDVREIKRLCEAKTERQRDIGARFGVTQTTVSAIVTGKLWAYALTREA